jgi:hypothetical protein
MQMQSPQGAREPIGVSHLVLVAAEGFGPRLDADRVAAALSAGLCQDGALHADACPLGEDLGSDFDVRMKAARAVVIAARRLDERTLLGSLPFEIATRARQAGVPAYAVAREDELVPFDARILDLQLVIQARSERALTQAGVRLAEVI